MSDMAESNGNGKTVKELINDLSGRFDGFALSQAHLQSQITEIAKAQAVHEAGDGHAGLSEGLKRVEDKLDTVLLTMAEGRGASRANERTWKVIAAVAGIPGVGALAAILFGIDPSAK